MFASERIVPQSFFNFIAKNGLCEQCFALLISLVPVPLVDLGLGDAEARRQRLDLLLAPERVAIEFGLQYLALEAVHARHEPLTVGLELVAGRFEHFVEAIRFEQAKSAQAVLVSGVDGEPLRC